MRLALLVALILLVFAVVGQRHKISRAADELSVPSVVAALVMVLLGLGASGLAWRALLAGFGAPLRLRSAFRVFFLGQLGKYLPGSVWPVIAQVELSRDLGVTSSQAGGAGVVALALSPPTAVLVAAMTLPFVSADALTHYWPVLLALPVAMVIFYPPVLNRALGKALKIVKRPPLPQPLTGPPLLVAIGWMVASWLAFGVSTWFLARDLGASDPGRLMFICIGGYALAWSAGFLVVFVPAGAGVREAVLALSLSPVLDHGSAILLAVVSRLIFTAGDLIWAAIGAALRPTKQPVEEHNAETTLGASHSTEPFA
jgi:uncharacterized membrane protein YbhN (UPF0104 family)